MKKSVFLPVTFREKNESSVKFGRKFSVETPREKSQKRNLRTKQDMFSQAAIMPNITNLGTLFHKIGPTYRKYC